MAITARGRKMGRIIAEFILMSYFFPGQKERSKLEKYKQDYLKDMNFLLNTGEILKSSYRLL